MNHEVVNLAKLEKTHWAYLEEFNPGGVKQSVCVRSELGGELNLLLSRV